MKEAHEEYNIGDIISEKGILDATIIERKLKGEPYSLICLRDGMFIIGIICNSEAWHCTS